MSHAAHVSHGASRTAGVDPNALEVHYEPIAELASGEIVGAEALMRRRMPSGVVQIAARFLPLAASTPAVWPGAVVKTPPRSLPLAESPGLIVELGRRVIDKACAEAAGWQK